MRPISSRVAEWFNTTLKTEDINDDIGRKTLVVYVLIFGGIILSLTATLICFVGPYANGGSSVVPASTPFLVLILFITLYFLCRSGKVIFASCVIIGLNILFGVYLAVHWGVDVPESLLIYSLAIITSSMLVNSRFALFITLFISAITYILFFLLKNNHLTIDSNWRSKPVLIQDILIYTAGFLVIHLVGWLSDTQIKKSLERVKTSEADLEKERDLLEVKVDERTNELKESQARGIEQLDRFIEFGKLSSGVFHDLVNYFNLFLFYFEKANDIDGNDVNRAKEHLEELELAKIELQRFIGAARQQLKNKESVIVFSPEEEIKKIIRIFSYLSKKAGIIMEESFTGDEKIVGDPIKFSHVVTAIISNAIDAYDDISDQRDKVIKIATGVNDGRLNISVKDNGCGILAENLNGIFDAFYTTKSPDKGTGLGLAIAKDLIVKEFKGEISVESVVNHGSVFIIKIPLNR